MFTGQKEQSSRKQSGKIVVGYDLGKRMSQISFCAPDGSDAETISSVAGTEQYNIPTILCKRPGVNQWFYGKEAIKYIREDGGIPVEDLLTLAQRGEEVVVEGESYDPAALLTLFVKRSLSLLSMRVPLNKIEALMFTVEDLTPRMVDVLGKVAGGLQLNGVAIYFQSYLESFYHYMLYQPKELWQYKVVIFDYDGAMKTLSLECNKKTTPQVVFISEKEYPDFTRISWPEEEAAKAHMKQKLDSRFLQVAEEAVSDGIVSTVYLLGDGFKEEWADESIRMLCRTRRVFQGNNLYSRGACFGAVERLCPGPEGKNHVFLGKDKLKSNIGMRVRRRGEDSYYAIMDAGKNWYETTADFEVILDAGNVLEFVIIPLTGEELKDRRIVLEGLPERPERTTRLRIHMEMAAVNQAVVTTEDMGFGELYPSSGKGWTHSISV
ncbi:MAG: hypothetical protein IKY23_01010 [Lachnospiraceae bacterium]|nr:hypothetical protein [Lachnospiraceae bacterium]